MNQPSPDDARMERYLLDYINSYARFYSRADSKILQRCREQMYQEREMDALIGRLERISGSLRGLRVLEIGSGSGSRAVAVALAGGDVVGIEPSGAGVRVSQLRAGRYPQISVRFQEGVAEKLPFPDASFDLVFSTEVLQHVRSLQTTFAETARVLKPGGHCYHECPNNLYPYEFHYRMFWLPLMPAPLGKLYARARGKDPRHLDDIHFLYSRSLIGLMRRYGFSDFGDLYSDELAAKAARTETIRSPAKRRLLGVCRRLGLVGPAVRAVTALGLYPQLRIHAVKWA